MRTLSLTQPWATLVAIGAKEIETRSWSTPYRGPLAIHAAKGLGLVGGKRGLQEICAMRYFHNALGAHVMPLGVIVAIVELYDIRKTSYMADAISQQELAFGDYSPGRYAWLLRNVQMLETPLPAVGALGLWEWQPPAEIEVKSRANQT